MELKSKTDYDLVWEDAFLITDFHQEDVEEQIRNAKDTEGERVLNIHYGSNFIGVSLLKKRGNMGCFSCYERQYDLNNISGLELTEQKYGVFAKSKEHTYARQIANTIAIRLMKLPKEEAAYVIYGDSLTVEKIHIRRIEDCKCCGTMETDAPKPMDFTTEEFFADIDSHRVKKKPDLEKLKRELIGHRSGMFQHKYRYYKSNYIPILCVEFNDVMSGRRVRTFGRSFSQKNVEASALLEGLERYSGMLPRRRKSLVRGIQKEIGERGINPEEFILHNTEDIERFGIVKYSREKPINWIWAYSWKKKNPVLIPEQIAYFDVNKNTEEKRFVYETSNGVSLGGSLQEAVLYGLYELIERDAFLLSWYNYYQPKKIALESIRDERIRDTVRLVQSNGYKIHIFDITTENRVPAIWVLLENPDANAKVRSYTAAGAHSNPYKALESALVEAITSMPIYESIMPKERERAHLLNADYSQVTKMEDHVLMYSVAESFEQLMYLFEKEEYRTIEQLYPWWEKEKEEISLTKTLHHILDGILKNHGDVYIVDQTNDLTERYGFYCAKVIIPTMLTIHFGEQFKRVNMDRVRNGAVLSGWREVPIDEKDINNIPHPFP